MSLRRDYENLPSLEIDRRNAELRRTDAYLLGTTAHYDPIFTPIFTAILGTGGFTIGTAFISYASIATAIATTALTIGISALLAPKPPKPEEGKFPLQQAIPFRIWGVGRNRIAGSYMLFENDGPNVVAVQAIAGHRIKSYNRYWLHDDLVERGSDGYIISPGADRYARPSPGDGVHVDTRIGLPVETAFAKAVTAFSGSGLWSAAHRGDGQASTCMYVAGTNQKNHMKRYPYNIPLLSTEVDMALVWDPRDPAQNPDNPSTWTWSQNAAQHIIWHLCFSEFGYRKDYRKSILPVLDLWIEDINICDEDVPLAGGGTEKRYQCNVWDTTENDPKASLNAMLAACDGHLVTRGDGALILTVGKFRETRCATITDRDILGHRIDYDVLPEDEVNRIVPKFNYPATDYSTTDTDFFEDIPAQLKAGRVLAADADYRAVQQWRQARRLGKREFLRARQKVRGQLDIRFAGLNAVYARWSRLETPLRMPRQNGKVIENRRSIIAITKGGYTMDFVENPDNIDAWTPATDEGQQPPVPAKPNLEGVVTPVINLVQAVASNGSVYVRVVVIDPEDTSLTPSVRYRITDIGGSPGAWVEQQFPDEEPVGGYVNLNTNVVPSDQNLDVQAAFISSGGRYSNWSPIETVRSTADPTPPAAVTGVSVIGGAGQATFNWTAPNSSNYAGAKIYYNTVNNFGTASYISPPKYGAANTADSVTKTIPAGVKFGWIVSTNRSGIDGTPVATGTFTVT